MRKINDFKKALLDAANWREQLTEKEYSTLLVSKAIERVIDRILLKYKNKIFTVEEIRKKLEEVNPQIKNTKVMNPFLYNSIEKWYNQLK
jgi:hypothetical protein